MKFQISDFPKMAVAAMATASIFIIDDYKPAITPATTSERISWDAAQRMRAAYLRTAPIAIEYSGQGGTRVSAPLEGFVMDAAAINEIMNNNQNGIGGKRVADALVVYFGKEEVAGKMEFRIIAAGLQNGVLLKNADAKNVANSSVFDRADPTPPNKITLN